MLPMGNPIHSTMAFIRDNINPLLPVQTARSQDNDDDVDVWTVTLRWSVKKC